MKEKVWLGIACIGALVATLAPHVASVVGSIVGMKLGQPGVWVVFVSGFLTVWVFFHTYLFPGARKNALMFTWPVSFVLSLAFALAACVRFLFLHPIRSVLPAIFVAGVCGLVTWVCFWSYDHESYDHEESVQRGEIVKGDATTMVRQSLVLGGVLFMSLPGLLGRTIWATWAPKEDAILFAIVGVILFWLGGQSDCWATPGGVE